LVSASLVTRTTRRRSASVEGEPEPSSKWNFWRARSNSESLAANCS
jgi:hypothetical protein